MGRRLKQVERRQLACKRPLDLELEAPSHAESSTPKLPKLEVEQDLQLLEKVLPVTPEMRNPNGATLTPDRTEAPQKLSNFLGHQPDHELQKAVDVALQTFTDALTAYILERDRWLNNVDAESDSDEAEIEADLKADLVAEQWATEHYDEIKNTMLSLLPWAGDLEPSKGGAYDVVQFHGCKTTSKELSKEELQHFRAKGPRARAWEGLCALMAAIANRKEKVWLELHDVNSLLDPLLEDLPLNKSKPSARRIAAIRKGMPGVVEDGAGAFAEYLIDPRSVHRLTFVRGPTGSLPTTYMTTRRMTLWDALKTMDDGGPLRAAAADKEWCLAAGRQFALQDFRYEHDYNKAAEEGHTPKERLHVKDLKPDRKLRDLLRSNKKVVLLDTLAALAPREIWKKQGFSEIVQTELATLYREAKERGEGVVFSMGSSNVHKLAHKVYLRPPLADYGMRCGNLRCRESAEAPWARELRWDERIALCLQLP